MGASEATAVSHANIAVAKYWGKRGDRKLNLPLFDSVSFGVEMLATETTVRYRADARGDEVAIDGVTSGGRAHVRLGRMFGELRRMLAGRGADAGRGHFELVSRNSFPSSAGLASSAAGGAAAAVAAVAAIGMDADAMTLSRLARIVSGSASRSIEPGWVRWRAGHEPDGSDSYAVRIAPSDYWPLHVVIPEMDRAPKPISSGECMELCRETSPFWDGFVMDSSKAADIAEGAIRSRDFGALSRLMLHNAMMLHSLVMSCSPPVCYLSPDGLKLLRIIRHLMDDGVEVSCTMDAGPNVVIVCTPRALGDVGDALNGGKVGYSLTRIGGGTRIVR